MLAHDLCERNRLSFSFKEAGSYLGRTEFSRANIRPSPEVFLSGNSAVLTLDD
jgi:hypothetical protein